MPAGGGLPPRDIEGGGGLVLEAPFLFGHRGGDILGADGSTLPTPVLSASVSSSQYVPLQFAQEHYSKLTAEYVEAGHKYQDMLKRVKEGYDRQLRDRQQVYENFVAELKEKAQRHVAVQQQLRKQEESRLQELLRRESVETSELRDKLASKTRELQEQQGRLDELKTSHARLLDEFDKRATADNQLLLEQQPVFNQQQQEEKQQERQQQEKQQEEKQQEEKQQEEKRQQQERLATELESCARRLEASDGDIARLSAQLAELTTQNQDLQAALSEAHKTTVAANESLSAAAAAAAAGAATAAAIPPISSPASTPAEKEAASVPSSAVQPLALPDSSATSALAQAASSGVAAPALPAKPPKPGAAAPARSIETQTSPRTEEACNDAAAPPAPTPTPTPAVAAVASMDATELQPTAAPLAAAADRAAVEALEDALHEARMALQQGGAKVAELEEGKEIVARQLAELLREKRTDVVKQLGEENEQLRQRLSESAESQAALKATTSKCETRAAEFKQRAETAEALLRSQDAAALAQLSADSEMGRARKENAKQREDLIAKSKAVTAGWDAAASAEERYDVDITRAFDKGFREASQRSQQAHDLLHFSLEEKEARIAELLRQAADHEQQRRECEQRAEAAERRANDAALEAADTIALMGGGGGGGEEDGGGASFSELDSARAELDAAQEEIVELQSRIEELEAAGLTSAQAIEVYEQLKSLEDKRPRQVAARPAASSSAGRYSSPAPQRDDDNSSRLTEMLIAVKSALGRGAGLWKAGKRDETFVLYKETTEDVLRCINSPVLVQPLREALDGSRSNDPGKFAPVLRRALEKFQQDGKTPAARRGEESAAQSAGGGSEARGKAAEADGEAAGEAAPDAASALVRELESELRVLRQQLAHTKQQEELRKQAPSGEAKEAGPRDTLQGSILTRAQRAERQVETLRKQLQMLASGSGAARGSSNGGSAGSGGSGGSGGADKVDVDLAVENRRLNRRVKLLEEQALVGGGGGGGGDGAGSKRAQVMAEKQAARKLKDLEASNKKEVRALEARAAKAEKEAKEAKEGLAPMKEERDALKDKVKALLPATVELERLREELGSLGRLKEESDRLASDLARVSATLVTESALRKKYKNELEDLKGAIRVYARCRPMARYEEERGCSAVVSFKDETSMSVASSRGDKAFEFDAVFGPSSTQEQVFEDTRRLVESCLDGFNVCLFAYGQTGSGKTHTLTGSAEQPGLTPRVIREIFRLIEEKSNQTVTVRTYFLELYLDSLVDLYQVLDSKRGRGDPSGPPKLEIKMDDKKMVYVRNAVIKDVGDPQELLDLFREGNLERHTGATKMNAESSRSHSIFSILLESYDKTTKRTISGKISLVDLAGSERADKTGASADRLKEAQAINKSLSALGDVIAALSEGEKFIPYRNNKLTQLMQDSLGGNAKTLMFVNFSPADYNSDETVSSLNYAARVKKIVNSAQKAIDSAEVARLKAIIKRLSSGLPGAADEEPDVPDADAGGAEAGGGPEGV